MKPDISLVYSFDIADTSSSGESARLAPQDLITQIQSNVIVADIWSEIISEDGKPLSYNESRAQRVETAIGLGEQAGSDTDVLDAIREEVIFKTNGGLTEEFGLGVGRTLLSISDELDKARTVIASRKAGYYSYPLGLHQVMARE